MDSLKNPTENNAMFLLRTASEVIQAPTTTPERIRKEVEHRPWDTTTSLWAVEQGDLEFLQWGRVCVPALRHSVWSSIVAVQLGHLAVLEWIEAEYVQLPWLPPGLIRCALGGCHFPILQWLLEHYGEARPSDLDDGLPPWVEKPECYQSRRSLAAEHRLQWGTNITSWLRAVDTLLADVLDAVLCPDLVFLVKTYT